MRKSPIAAALLLSAAVLAGPVACKKADDTANAPATPAASATPGTEAGIDPAAMDKSVKPGDQFYDFANGTWSKNAQIPADRSSIGSFLTAFNETERQQGELIQAIIKSDPAPGSTEAMIKNYYQAYMNPQAIDAAGMAPVKPDLDRYAAIADKTQLAKVLGDQTEVDVDLFNSTDLNTENLFGLFITKSLTGPDTVPYLFQGGLGMPDREYYLSNDAKMAGYRTAYRKYVADLLAAAGMTDAQARADRIVALETKIAKAHASAEALSDFTKGGTLWKKADFASKAPGIDWKTYFDAARLGAQDPIDVYDAGSIKGLAALVGSEPLDAWKDWLAFHRINAAAQFLPGKIDQLHFAFYGTQLSGTPEQRSRDKRALAAVNADLGNAFGKLYVDKYFPASAKAEVEQMADAIKTAFAKRIDALDWMAPATKKEAKAKVSGMVVGVGYPDTWIDYSSVKITPDNPYANHMAAVRAHTLEQLAKLGKPQDTHEWWMDPQLVNAVNLPVQNALNFPAAILQKPFFDPKADAAYNYGAIGAVIGHEISHSFDSNGALVDAKGDLRNWWTPADFAHFKAESDALAKQYDSYEPLPGLHINGKQTLGENGADLAGLNAAFDAYRASLHGKELPVIDGYTGDQRFFIAFAQTWQSKMREAALRQRVVTDGHAPGPWRALTVRNIGGWYKAFGIEPGAKLYLAPDKRVKIW